MSDSMQSLVEDALACVARECPDAYVAMRASLGARRLSLVVGAESFDVALEGEGPRATVEVATTAAALHAIVRGDDDPHDAVIDERVRVRGGPADVIAAAEAGLFFVKGAARCVSLPRLSDRLARLAEREG